MGIKNFFRKQGVNDLDRLNAASAILSEATIKFFDEDEFDKVNIIELFVFVWAFNSVCYLMMKDSPSKTVLADFGQFVTDMITERVLLKQKPNATNDEIEQFYHLVVDLGTRRQNEYIDLFQKETAKPRGSVAFVDLTSSILSHLFDAKEVSREMFDPLFSAILVDHISRLGKLLNSR